MSGGDLFGTQEPAILPARKAAARLNRVLIGDGAGFSTRAVDRLTLTLAGIAGDRHAGFARPAGGREPWYPRGAEMRSGRQLTVVGEEELAALAAALGLPAVDAATLGANLVLAGLPQLSFLPAGTRLHAPGGAALVVEGQNAPCRHAGRALAARHPGRDDLELAFVAAARRRRGLVASVERPGILEAGTPLSLRLPEQWIYR